MAVFKDSIQNSAVSPQHPAVSQTRNQPQQHPTPNRTSSALSASSAVNSTEAL
jgi:hypothetical protein